MGSAEFGYPEASAFERSSLRWTHVFWLPPMYLAWKIRHQNPWPFLSLLLSLLASYSYHDCYSYDVCVFHDKRLHRHFDHYFSLMIVPVALTRFLYVRKRVCKQPPLDIVAAPSEHVIPYARGPFLKDSASSVPQATDMPQNSIALGPGVRTSSNALPVGMHTDGSYDVYERPVWIDAFLYALYLINVFMHISHGIQHYASMQTLAIGFLLIVGVQAGQIWEHGLRLRLLVAVSVAVPLLLANGLFMLDNVFGAGGHSTWHVFGMLGLFIYWCWGPIFVDGDGTYVVEV